MTTSNPFPGMNPWLEAFWRTVHHSYVQYCRDQIADALPGGLFAEVEETVYVISSTPLVNLVRPDVGVFRAGGPPDESSVAVASPPVATPIRIRVPNEEVSLGHVAIREARGNALVTAIEVISPTNKCDPRGRKAYAAKRQAYYDGVANVVEIDLLRTGEPLVDVLSSELPADAARAAYRACVRRFPVHEAPLEAEYYPLPLRQRLARIAIPLREGDADVALDLQQPIDLAYERGRFATRIAYDQPPVPPLDPSDEEWATAVLRERGVLT